MTYTVEQGMAVAMFNAGVREEGQIIGLPTGKAKEVVRYLDQMGFKIDPTEHWARAPVRPEHTEMLLRTIRRDDGDCTREGCGKPQSEHDFGVFCP